MAALNVGGFAASVAQALDIIAGLGLVGVPTISGTWANRATYLAAGHTCVLFTDIGVGGGTVWRYSTRWRPAANRYLAAHLTSSTGHTVNTRAVSAFAGFVAGQVQDGDLLEMWFHKVMTGASGAEADTTETAVGTVNTTYGTSLGLSTAALTNTNVALATRYAWRRINATTLRAVSIGGNTGLGSATSVIADVTTVPDMDVSTWFLQLSSQLTSGAVSATSALRGFSVWHSAGA